MNNISQTESRTVDKGDISEKRFKKPKRKPKKQVKSNKCLYMLIGGIIVSIIVLGVIIFLAVRTINNKNKNDKELNDTELILKPSESEQVVASPKKKEFEIISKVGDLKQISIVQKSKAKQKLMIRL